MEKSVPAIFLDRDGTINVDYGYVHEINKFKFINGVIDAMHELKRMGYALVIVTNQSGIARGKFTETQFEILTKWMSLSLAYHGVNLDGIYYCPNHPQGLVKAYRQACNYRKPYPGMFISAQQNLHINMLASYMVGDKLEDMQAATAAGIGHKILVRTGKLVTPEAESSADLVVDSLVTLSKKLKLKEYFNKI